MKLFKIMAFDSRKHNKPKKLYSQKAHQGPKECARRVRQRK